MYVSEELLTALILAFFAMFFLQFRPVRIGMAFCAITYIVYTLLA